MIRNLLPRTSGRSSAAFSFSALLSGTAKGIASTRQAVCLALLLALGWALCGEAAQAQTANYGGVQVQLVNTLTEFTGGALDASGNFFFISATHVEELPSGCASSSCVKAVVTTGLTRPQSVAVDASGNLYVADSTNGLLKYTHSGSNFTQGVIANGTSSPALTSAQGVAVDANCNVYVTEDITGGNVFKYTAGTGGCAAVNYTASTVASDLNDVVSVAVDASGNVFLALPGSVIKETLNGGMYTPSTVVTAPLNSSVVNVVAVDAADNVYVGAQFSSIARFTPNGSGGYSQTVLGADFGSVVGLAVNGKGDVFVTEAPNTISEILTPGVNLGSSAVGTATAPGTLIFNFTNTTAATIGAPIALTGGATGKDFAVASGGTCNTTTSYGVGDGATSSCTVNVTVTPSAPGLRMGAVELTTTSGAVIATAYVNGTGTGPQVAFQPGVQQTVAPTIAFGLAVDDSGNFYAANGIGQVIKYPAGTTVVNLGTDTDFSVALDGAGNLYVPDFTAGTVTQYVPNGSGGFTQSTVVATGLGSPYGVAADVSGNIYVSDFKVNEVFEYATNGSGVYTQSTVASSGLDGASGVAVDAPGNVYVVDTVGNTVNKYTPNSSGGFTQSAVASDLNAPSGVSVDALGNVYVANTNGNEVTEYTPNGSGGFTNAGNVGTGLSKPAGLAVDAGGNVFIGDLGTTPATGLVMKVDISDPPSLTFAKTAVGSTNGPQTVTVANIGNEPLTIESNPVVTSNPASPANFALDGTSACGAFTEPINQGASCALALDFTPQTSGPSLTGTAKLFTNNLNNTSATQTINLSGSTPASTSTTVTSSLNPSALNTTVTFTATVTNTSGSGGAPTGTVQFVVDGTNSGSPVALTLGDTSSTAQIQLSNLTAGSAHTIAANYLNSDGDFADSNGTLSGGQTVNQATTMLKLSQSVATPTVNVPDTLTAVISTSSTSPIAPTGTVSFTQNGSSVTGCSTPQNVSLVGNSYQASCTATTLPAPSVAVIATYSGDNNFTGSSNPLNIPVVNKATPAYTLSAAAQSPNASITVNVPVIFTAAFSSPISSLPTQPTGTVPVTQGGATLCTITLPATTCTYSSGFATATSFTVTSSYSGDSQFNTVTSGSIPVSVSATGTMTKVTGPSTANSNTPVTFTAAVTSNVAGAAAPQGTVTFNVTNSSSNTITACSSVTLSSGSATCSYAFTSGNYTVNATYTPNPANFVTSTSANVPVTVTASPVSISVALDSGSVNPSVINQTVKFDSSLTFPTGNASPNGLGDTIVYSDGANMLCTVAVNTTTSPFASSCTVNTLALGGHSITAAFVPGATDTNFKGQTSSAIPQAVNADSTTLSASASPATPAVNETYTLSATVTPKFVFSGTAGRSPAGGNVSFTYANGTSTVTLCTATVGTNSTASCSPAAGTPSTGNYTVTATYVDSASPANFVTSSGTTSVNVGKDTPVVKLGTIAATTLVNQALTLSASINPNFNGPVVPSGSVAFIAGTTTLCTATVNNEFASCAAAYTDLPVSATPYSISATYTPDTAGSANFLTASTTASASVTVTAATTSVKVASTPIVGYAAQTVTYVATVSTGSAIPTGGIVPTGTVTFADASALPFAGTNCPTVTIPAGATFPYSVSCTVTYPMSYTANLNTDSITAAYTSSNGNFAASSNSANPLIVPIQNFSLGFTPSSSSIVSLTQGGSTTNDSYFGPQTVAAVSVSTATTGPGTLTDALVYTCTVSSGSSIVSDPSCSPATSTGAPGASVPYTISASSTAQSGAYTINVTATDPNSGLSYAVAKQLSIATVSTQSLIFAGSVPQTLSVGFNTLPNGGTLTLVGCPEIKFSTETAARQNPDPTASNALYVACSASSAGISSGSTPLSVTITPCQTGTSGTSGATTSCGSSTAALAPEKAKSGHSGSSYIAVVLGAPVLVFFGWFGRNRARKNLFRMMTILLLGWSALTVSGCGGGYKLTSSGSSSPATNLAPGTYSVLVQATDSSTPANIYYSVVTITVN
jgi:large repetitive protein